MAYLFNNLGCDQQTERNKSLDNLKKTKHSTHEGQVSYKWPNLSKSPTWIFTEIKGIHLPKTPKTPLRRSLPICWVEVSPFDFRCTPAIHFLQQLQSQHPMVAIGHGSHRRTETHLPKLWMFFLFQALNYVSFQTLHVFFHTICLGQKIFLHFFWLNMGIF